MATIRGAVGIRWGTNGIGATACGASALFQSFDVENKIDETEVKDGSGEVRAWYGYNPTREGTFTYYVAGASQSTQSAVTKPDVGSLMSVTGNTGSDVTSSYWLVKSSTENATNTDATKITVKATEYQYITT
jgi:hypothetical protein